MEKIKPLKVYRDGRVAYASTKKHIGHWWCYILPM